MENNECVSRPCVVKCVTRPCVVKCVARRASDTNSAPCLRYKLCSMYIKGANHFTYHLHTLCTVCINTMYHLHTLYTVYTQCVPCTSTPRTIYTHCVPEYRVHQDVEVKHTILDTQTMYHVHQSNIYFTRTILQTPCVHHTYNIHNIHNVHNAHTYNKVSYTYIDISHVSCDNMCAKL